MESDEPMNRDTARLYVRKRWNTHVFRILVEAGLDKLLKLLRVIPSELWRIVLRYQKEHSHGMQLAVGWLSFR